MHSLIGRVDYLCPCYFKQYSFNFLVSNHGQPQVHRYI
uniref:Uncharacterized protein n=1 Tax=Rhizophora mucronata TaxID=61149 RepID=A0A2P2QCT8_RHIMU